MSTFTSGGMKPAESLTDYALFISLFPHLIAGPIQRPSHLLPQVQNEREFDGDKFFSGLMLILCGLFRKCVVADNCALLANAVFAGKLGEPSLPIILLGTYAFAWQIYGDFSGYSDIARGSAQLLGFHFMVNFRQPYLAISLQDFWRRWHISLSSWLRDYLYIPLGGSRGGEGKTNPQFDDHHAPRRSLARRKLDVRDLGRNSWHGACRRKSDTKTVATSGHKRQYTGSPAEFASSTSGLVGSHCRISHNLPDLGLLQSTDHSRCV